MLRSWRTPVLVALLGVAVATLIALRILATSSWDPTAFVAFGEEETPSRAYAESQLGDVYLRPYLGHDGKFFFIQANDPLFLDPDRHASALDRPLYRGQRMLFPLLAGGGGLFSPQAIVWAMLVANLVAIGVGTWAVALLATELGGSPWWGLAFALNIGFISEMNIGGAGIVAAAAAFGAVVAFVRGKDRWGVALLVMAVLSREAMLIAAAGSSWWLWGRSRRRTAMAATLTPAAAAALWALYLRLRIGWDQPLPEVQELGVPFGGFVEAFQGWVGDPVDMVVGLTMMLLLVLYTRRVLLGSDLVGWAFLGFVALGVVFTEQVWRSYFDITRALAPVTTSFVLLVFARRSIAATNSRSTQDFALEGP